MSTNRVITPEVVRVGPPTGCPGRCPYMQDRGRRVTTAMEYPETDEALMVNPGPDLALSFNQFLDSPSPFLGIEWKWIVGGGVLLWLLRKGK